MNLGRQLEVVHIADDEVDAIGNHDPIDREHGWLPDDTDVNCGRSGRGVDPGRLESVRVRGAVGVGHVLRP